MPTTDLDRNRLQAASSPYLRQHAGNPVHWQPWDEATLAHARKTDTPILLSIGYSACHWCHVMAHECFENPEIARAMNAGFVNIKLDREERPDIDRVYQLAHQAFNRRGGGWPLTAFLDPQTLSPFYIGTYFPPAPRHGLPGFREVLTRVRDYFHSHREDIRAQAGQLREWIAAMDNVRGGDIPGVPAVTTRALERVASRFDSRHGGTEGAPKFPRATELEWLLDLDGDDARGMAQLTLATMATRGLQDHLGGGFFRYCVDADWTIPHFEKMLYDNAQLLPVHARLAATATAPAAERETASDAVHGIVEWLARDMTVGGALCSSLDADSEGSEGAFYLWTRDQMRTALDDADFALATAAFGLDRDPNFEGRAWHLLRDMPVDAIARHLGAAPQDVRRRLGAMRRRLFDTRTARTPPARDDKILTAWNALTIAGLARGARLLDEPRFAAMAHRVLAALRTSAWIDGKLFANAAPPAQRIPGFLDDHAFLLDALLEAMQLSFDAHELDWSLALADALLENFEDRDAGGFRFSTPQHATPLARGRDWTDDALPNGNAVAIRSLLRVGHLVGDTRYVDSAGRALRAAAGALDRYPEACPTLMRALAEYQQPRPQLVVRCPRTRQADWHAAARDAARAAGIAPGGDPIDIFVMPIEAGILPGLLASREPRGDAGTAWLCQGTHCLAPVDAPERLAPSLHAALAK